MEAYKNEIKLGPIYSLAETDSGEEETIPNMIFDEQDCFEFG